MLTRDLASAPRPRAYPHTVVAADVGALVVRVAVLLGGRLGKVTTHRTAELLAESPAGDDLLPGLARVIRAIAPADAPIDLVGVAVDGHVDGRGRIVGPRPAGIPAEDGLRRALEERLELPVLVDGAAALAALGEARQGAGRGHREVVFLSLGPTIEVGIVSDRRIVRGARGAAGSVGRILLPSHRGVSGRDVDARVPRIGAAESDGPTGYVRLDEVAGGDGLARVFTDGTRPLELRPEASDRRGKAAARQGIEGWALLVSDIAVFLDPEVIVLGGEIMTAAPGLAPALRKRVEELMPALDGIPAPDLRLGRLGVRAALIGASVASRAALTAGQLRRRSTAAGVLPAVSSAPVAATAVPASAGATSSVPAVEPAAPVDPNPAWAASASEPGARRRGAGRRVAATTAA